MRGENVLLLGEVVCLLLCAHRIMLGADVINIGPRPRG